MKKILLSVLLLLAIGVTNSLLALLPNAWINEIHYDNSGTDVAEIIEVVIKDEGLTISDFGVTLYNGNNGLAYGTKSVGTDFTYGGTTGGYLFYYFTYPVNGIQNGSPDGMALSYSGSLIQFLSYEGTFTAMDGVANGTLSTDIGVVEGAEAAGFSLQLTGSGTQYADFS